MLQRYIIDPQTGEKRFNLELFLPLGGMIIVGIVGLVLGTVYFEPNERPDEGPIDLPPIESYEQNHKKSVTPPAHVPAPPSMSRFIPRMNPPTLMDRPPES